MIDVLTPEESYRRYRELLETIKVGEFLEFQEVIFVKVEGEFPFRSVFYLFEVMELVSPHSLILKNILDGEKTVYNIKEQEEKTSRVSVNKHVFTRGLPTNW